MLDDAVGRLASFIFRLGFETAEIKALQKDLLEKSKAEAFDAGFALGQETVLKDLGEPVDLELPPIKPSLN